MYVVSWKAYCMHSSRRYRRALDIKVGPHLQVTEINQYIVVTLLLAVFYTLYSTIHNSSLTLILDKVQETTSFQGLQSMLGNKHWRKHHIYAEMQPNVSEEKVEWVCITVAINPNKSNRVYMHSAGCALQHSSAQQILRRNSDPESSLLQALSIGDK